jgi:hypothetical protein
MMNRQVTIPFAIFALFVVSLLTSCSAPGTRVIPRAGRPTQPAPLPTVGRVPTPGALRPATFIDQADTVIRSKPPIFLSAVIPPNKTISTPVAWDLLPNPNIDGYGLSYGLAPDALTSKLAVGLTNACTLSNLQPATLYYIAIAGTSQGIELDRSAPIQFLQPGVLMLSRTNQSVTLRFLPAGILVLNASSDLKHWTNFFYPSDPQHVAEFSDPITTRRFYKLTAL